MNVRSHPETVNWNCELEFNYNRGQRREMFMYAPVHKHNNKLYYIDSEISVRVCTCTINWCKLISLELAFLFYLKLMGQLHPQEISHNYEVFWGLFFFVCIKSPLFMKENLVVAPGTGFPSLQSFSNMLNEFIFILLIIWLLSIP